MIFGLVVSKAEVGVNARGARMIIARAEMHVLAEPIGIAPDDEQRFAVRFQSDHAVDDMRARFLQPARPLDVGGFIKARAQFHQRGDLFAGGGRVDQRFDDRRIAARAIKRDLDREHLRILRGVLDEFDDRIETFVGMMQEDVLFAHDLEDIGVRRQRGIARRLKDAILQFGEGIVRHQRREMRHRERAVEPVKIRLRRDRKTRGAIRGNPSGNPLPLRGERRCRGWIAAVPARCCAEDFRLLPRRYRDRCCG